MGKLTILQDTMLKSKEDRANMARAISSINDLEVLVLEPGIKPLIYADDNGTINLCDRKERSE